MNPIPESISEHGRAVIARAISGPLPKLNLRFTAAKIDVQEEHKEFLTKIPERVFVRGKRAYPNDFCFLDGKQVAKTLYPPVKDSPERRLISLANLFFTFNDRDDELFEYINTIPGIDIIDRRDRNAPNKYCDWFVFKDEPWFPSRQERSLFEPSAIQYLEKKGYQRIHNQEIGAVVVYFHSQNANEEIAGRPAHYGKIVAIDGTGEPIVESKFMQFCVYRHRQGLVPSPFGNEVVYLKKR